jgi:cytochrome c oxidase subunit 2
MNVNSCKFAGIGAFFGYRSYPNSYIIVFHVFSMKKEIIVGGILVISIFAILFVFNNSDSTQTEIPDGEIKEFDIVAKQWEFSPGTIEVNFGDRVILNIESIDVSHGILIPAFEINKRIEPGEEVKIEFLADKKGTFSFSCNVFCGQDHYGMVGKIVVN